MLQTTEIARLIIALVVLPFILLVGRQVRTSGGSRYFLHVIVAVYVSYVATVAEEYWAEGLTNAIQHVALAFASVFALLAALYVRRERLTDTDDM